MTHLDEKAQAQLVRWIMKTHPGLPRLSVIVAVYKINEQLMTPETVKNYGQTRLQGLRLLSEWLGLTKTAIREKLAPGEGQPEGPLEFEIPGLEKL